MSITVETCDPYDPAAKALLEQSHALMTDMYPADACHFLSLDALCTPEIKFFVAKLDGQTVGCGAVAQRDGYGEVKSMFVDPSARGKKIADHILTHLMQVSRDLGLPKMMLETGVGLDAAHRLYEKHGFEYCGAFGAYDDNPLSLFMTKDLD